MYPSSLPLPEKQDGNKFSVLSCQFSVFHWELRTGSWELIRSDLSFSISFSSMVRSGLAGAHVQPCPRKNYQAFGY